ncbi:MAG: hypothetical protein ACRDUT_04460 [Mycobacterium sp.]
MAERPTNGGPADVDAGRIDDGVPRAVLHGLDLEVGVLPRKREVPPPTCGGATLNLR